MNMKRFLKNIARTSLAVGALSASAVAGADEYSCHPCGWDCAPQAPQCGYGYNPPGYLRCGNGGDFWDGLGGRVDFLWWKASEDSLLFGFEDEVDLLPATTVAGSTISVNNVHDRYFNTTYDPGFRLGLTHYCPCDCWDAALVWTHYHTKGHAHGESASVPTTGAGTAPTDFFLFVPAWERIAGTHPDVAKGHWALNLDLLDLEFGYKYLVSSCFSVRPSFGLRGARIYQTVRTFAEASRADTNAVFGPNSFVSRTHSVSNFLGLGPRVGVDLKLDLGCGLSLVGQAAGSILFGRLDRHAQEDYLATTTTGTAPFPTTDVTYDEKNKTSFHSRAVTDLAVGVEWDHCFTWCNRCHPLTLAFLWEHHGFYSFSDFNFNNDGYNASGDEADLVIASLRKPVGDLFTQGLTISLNVGF